MPAKNTYSLRPNPWDTKQTTRNLQPRWQPLPKTSLIRGSYQMSCSIGRTFFSFIVTFFIWFPEKAEQWKEQAVLEQLIPSFCHIRRPCSKQFSETPFQFNLHHISDVVCRPWLNNEVQAFSHPHEVHRGLRSLPMAESQSSTTVLETGRLIRSVIVLKQQWRLKWANARPSGIRTHFPQAQQSSWRRCCRFMERLAGIVN